MRGHKGLIAGIVVGACLLAGAPGALARDVTVISFDGTKINAHFYPGKGVNAQHPAPTILEGPGWSQAATRPAAARVESSRCSGSSASTRSSTTATT